MRYDQRHPSTYAPCTSLSVSTAPPGILAIDDQPANLQLLMQLLGEAGYEVRAALDGEAGLRAALRLPPDLILLDIHMPALDGYEVCRRFKHHATLADIPIIFVSAAEETVDKVLAFGVGGVDYVVRPFQVEELLARVNTHIRLFHAYRQGQEIAALRERERLARELHDAVNQTLFSIKLTAETALRQHISHPETTPDLLMEISTLVQEAMVEMRVLMHELRGDPFEHDRLSERLTDMATSLSQASATAISVDAAPIERLPPHIQVALYRIAQEALTNIVRHAKADHASLSLKYTPNGARLMIRDDGIGFDVTTIGAGHYGIANIRTRAADIDATCIIDSQPGRGTTLMITVQGAWDDA
jgi:signal transduction histidine kinase